MPRDSYGVTTRQKVWRLIKDLIEIAGTSLVEASLPQSEDFIVRWTKNKEGELQVKCKLSDLRKITRQDNGGESLSTTTIYTLITTCLEDFLGIVNNRQNTGRSNKNWHFTLKLWTEEIDSNKIEFERAWHEAREKKELPRLPPLSNNHQMQVSQMDDSNHYASTEIPQYPDRPLAIDSKFYIERLENKELSIEKYCYQEIQKPGNLIRVKAAPRMGKTSLLNRIINQAQNHNYRTAYLNFKHHLDQQSLIDLDTFLQWFCGNIGHDLGFELQLNRHWKNNFLGSMRLCEKYLDEVLSESKDRPLLLVLDDLEELFSHHEISDKFLAFLRGRHDEASRDKLWEQFRIVIAHSTEPYIKQKDNHSPFNIGVPIQLLPLNKKEVQNLEVQYKLDDLSEADLSDLITLTGGHPYLIQLALYHIWEDKILIPTEIYKNHLEEIWRELKNASPMITSSKGTLLQNFQKVISSDKGVILEQEPAFKLEALGLIQKEGKLWRVTCKLYQDYFYNRFQSAS